MDSKGNQNVQNKGTDGEEGQSDDTDDPVDVLPDGPSEPEHADRKEHGRKQSRHESVFLWTEPVLLDIGFEVEIDIAAVDGASDDAAHDDTQEDNTQLSEVEAVDANVRQRKGFKVRVVDAVDQRGVDIGEEDGGIAEEDLDGLDQLFHNDLGEGRVALVDFTLAFQVRPAGQFAQAFRSAEQDIRRRCFGHGDEHEQKDGPG